MKEKSKKISTESYKGVRDFYPKEMAVQNYIFSIMRKVAESFGYSEYNASVLEPAELYKAKSGEEIVNDQTYTFIDKGEREVSLRPEMTPTLARMIAGKGSELAMPVRWYSIPNLFRYENPQKGRMREHWQLNVDIFGVESTDAEVEVISMAYSILKKLGLKDNNFEIRVNNRKIINYILNDLFDLTEEESYKIAKLLDKKDKLNAKEYENAVRDIMPKRYEGFLLLMNSENFEEFISRLPQDENVQTGIREIRELIEKLEKLGITNVVFKQGLMRGFDYYTGIVFEIFDTNPENRRSVFGGGRYDDLLEIFGKEKIPAVGFGCGDVIIKDILSTYGLMPTLKPSADLYICLVDRESIWYAQDLAQKLRESNINVSVDYSSKKIGEQIKYADKNKIPYVLCIGADEVKSGQFKIKELSTGKEENATEESIANIIKK